MLNLSLVFSILIAISCTFAQANEGETTAYTLFVPPGTCGSIVGTCPNMIAGGSERRRLRPKRILDDDEDEDDDDDNEDGTGTPIGEVDPATDTPIGETGDVSAAAAFFETYGGVSQIAICLQGKINQIATSGCGQQIKGMFNALFPDGLPEDPTYVPAPNGPLTVRELDEVLLVVKEEVEPEGSSDGITVVLVLGGLAAVGGAAYAAKKRLNGDSPSSLSGIPPSPSTPKPGSTGPVASSHKSYSWGDSISTVNYAQPAITSNAAPSSTRASSIPNPPPGRNHAVSSIPNPPPGRNHAVSSIPNPPPGRKHAVSSIPNPPPGRKRGHYTPSRNSSFASIAIVHRK